MTRAGIAGPVVLGHMYSDACHFRFKNSFLYGGLRNPSMPVEFAKYNNIMLIQRRTLCESFQLNAEYFDSLAAKTDPGGPAHQYYCIRSQLLKECAFRMS